MQDAKCKMQEAAEKEEIKCAVCRKDIDRNGYLYLSRRQNSDSSANTVAAAAAVGLNSTNTCMHCIGILMGYTSFPYCRFCGPDRNDIDNVEEGRGRGRRSMCKCSNDSASKYTDNVSKKCSKCRKRRHRNHYLDHDWFANDVDNVKNKDVKDAGANSISTSTNSSTGSASSSGSSRNGSSRICLACFPMEDLWKVWAMNDRQILYRLSRHGIQIFDCDSTLEMNDDTDGIDDEYKYSPLPPMRDVLGKYDIIFTKWKTCGSENDYGDVLLNRTITGSLHLTSSTCTLTGTANQNKSESGNYHSNNGGSNDSDSDNTSTDDEIPIGGGRKQQHGRVHTIEEYKHLAGCITFDKGIFEDNQMDTISVCPYGTNIVFRFSEGLREDQGDTIISAFGDGEDVAYVIDHDHGRYPLTCDTDIRNVFQNPDAGDKIWGGSFGCEAEMQMIRGNLQPFPWVPREYYVGEDTYASRMRQEIEQRMNSPPNWSNSWLHRRMSLPLPVVQLIHDFMRFDHNLLTPEFATEPGDLLLTFRFSEYIGSLEVSVIARRQEGFKRKEKARNQRTNKRRRIIIKDYTSTDGEEDEV